MNELSDWLTNNLPATDNEVTLVHGDFRLDNLIFHPTEVWVLEQRPLQIFSCVWCFTKLRLMPPDTRDCSVGLGAVYHWAAPGRPGLLPYVPLLACEPSPPLYGQPERNWRWWEQILALNRIIIQKIHFKSLTMFSICSLSCFHFFSVSLSNKRAGIPTVDDLISIYCQCKGVPSNLPQLNFYLALSLFKIAGISQVCLKFYCDSSPFSFFFSYMYDVTRVYKEGKSAKHLSDVFF